MHGMKPVFRFLLFCGLTAQTSALTAPAKASTCDSGQQVHQLVEAALRSRGISEDDLLPFDEELCSRAAQVRDGESLELMKVRWDQVLRSIELRLRCKSSAACLPFLLRVRTRGFERHPAFSNGRSSGDGPEDGAQTERTLTRTLRLPKMVRPGQMVTLIWEQGDMRISRRVVCLDVGGKDQEVRTRSKEGGRVVRARVLAEGLVKAL
jgi:hypothetical protein